MTLLELLGISVGLGMDAMSVCMGVGVKWHGVRQKFRMAWHMGLFQFLMPIIGWYVGQELAGYVRGYGKYVAALLVVAVGGKMLWEALKSKPGAMAERAEHGIEKELHMHPKDPTRGLSLIILSVATSLDALVVGFSLGLKDAGTIWGASIVIGVVAALMSLCGIVIGKRIGQKLGRPAEILGAVVLVLLGISFVLI